MGFVVKPVLAKLRSIFRLGSNVLTRVAKLYENTV